MCPKYKKEKKTLLSRAQHALHAGGEVCQTRAQHPRTGPPRRMVLSAVARSVFVGVVVVVAAVAYRRPQQCGCGCKQWRA